MLVSLSNLERTSLLFRGDILDAYFSMKENKPFLHLLRKESGICSKANV